jgi:O-acetylhomoserine (thiol)-lyase
MRNETIALHAGFDMDPATRSVAIPIYQTPGGEDQASQSFPEGRQ